MRYHLPPRLHLCRHASSSSIPAAQSAAQSAAHNTRWLAETKARLGRLFFHGTTPAEATEAAAVLRNLTDNWRSYVAGAEGFLVNPLRRGLFRHAVAWGDMDSMV